MFFSNSSAQDFTFAAKSVRTCKPCQEGITILFMKICVREDMEVQI